MKTLYWSREARFGRSVEWRLVDKPGKYFPAIVVVSRQYANVFRSDRKVWRATIRDLEFRRIALIEAGSSQKAKRLVEREIDRRSIGLFNDDDVEFVNDPA